MGRVTNKLFLYDFIRQHKYAVLATVSPGNLPEAAYVGIAVTPELNIIFDTVSESRKYQNLLLNPNISFVIGWEDEQTLQYEGIATLPDLSGSDKLLETYFEVFPEGRVRRETWPNISYVCVKPTWIRYSDFNEPVLIEETKFE